MKQRFDRPDPPIIISAVSSAADSRTAPRRSAGGQKADSRTIGAIGVLLADDVLRSVTMRRLELLGYTVTPIPEDPAAAPVVAADAGLGGVLIDLDLPDGAGLRVVERLASDESTAGIPTLGMAADTPQGLIEEAFAIGVSDFLILPYDPLLLESKAAGLLARTAQTA
ncbi:MAG: hypothetical protein AAF907_01860 [Planctomycetota bacterium]